LALNRGEGGQRTGGVMDVLNMVFFHQEGPSRVRSKKKLASRKQKRKKKRGGGETDHCDLCYQTARRKAIRPPLRVDSPSGHVEKSRASSSRRGSPEIKKKGTAKGKRERKTPGEGVTIKNHRVAGKPKGRESQKEEVSENKNIIIAKQHKWHKIPGNNKRIKGRNNIMGHHKKWKGPRKSHEQNRARE